MKECLEVCFSGGCVTVCWCTECIDSFHIFVNVGIYDGLEEGKYGWYVEVGVDMGAPDPSYHGCYVAVKVE